MRPPTDDQRTDAVRILDRAYAEGQLDSDEHQARLTRVMEAQDARYISWQLMDLQQPPPPPPKPPTAAERTRAALVRARTAGGRTGRRFAIWVRSGPWWERAAMGVLAVVVVGGFALAVVAQEEESLEPGMVALTAETNSATRIEAFREAYEDEFGTTVAGRIQMDPENVSVEVPVDGSPTRAKVLHLQNGAFNDYGSYATGARPRVDLADIDLAAAQRNLDLAFTSLGVEGPDEITILIAGNLDGEPTIVYVARNEFEEEGRLTTDLAGNVLDRRPFEPPPG